MRATFLLLFIAVLAVFTVIYPFAGFLTWTWLSLMTPHQLTHGTLSAAPLNFLIASITLAAWLLSSEPKKLPRTPEVYLFCTLILFLLLSQIFSLDPEHSQQYFDRFLRVLVFIMLAFAMVNTRARIQATLWVLVISIGFYCIKGGIFMITSGGRYRVWGPENTLITDNNSMGLAAIIIAPLCVFLFKTTKERTLRLSALGLAGLSVITAIGSQSRGALISLGVMLLYQLGKSRHRVRYGTMVFFSIFVLFSVMPQTWLDRMETIGGYSVDSSFQNRTIAWRVNWELAKRNPFTGSGLRVSYLEEFARPYLPDTARARSAHSMYFEILGGMGFIAFTLYILILFHAWKAAGNLAKASKDSWSSELGAAGRMSLIAALVGGAALSIEMWDGLLLIIVILAAANRLLSSDQLTDFRR